MTSAVRRRAGTATLALLTALALAACSGSSTDSTPVSGDSTAPASTDPTRDGGDTEEPTQEPPLVPPHGKSNSTGVAVPLYYAGDTPSRSPRLFREFRRVNGDPLTAAARLVAGGGEPIDPDYRTLWPQVEIDSVSATDGVLLVEIDSDAFTERPDGMSRREARLAVQQLVRTLQGVQQERVPVQILRDQGPARLFGLSTKAPFRAASTLKTLSHINITSPAEGDTVSKAGSGNMLKVTGVANSFEASGPCRFIVGGKEMALAAYQSEGWMGDRLFAFEVKLPLAGIRPGKVVVQCETDDPSGGTEGNGPDIDTKSITVR